MSFGLFESFCPLVPQGPLGSLGCFVASWEIPILVLAVAGIAAILWLRKSTRYDDEDPGLLILPMGGAAGPREPRGGVIKPSEEEYEKQRAELRKALSSVDAAPDATATSAPGGAVDAPDEPATTDRVTIPSDQIPEADPKEAPPRWDGASAGRSEPDRVETWQLPPEGTLQLLPGRLEIVRGPGSGKEIRFVRVPGTRAEVTVGRLEGPPHRHVQLVSPTVSRTHARLTFESGVWKLRNESSTNPTIYNGRVLDSGLEEVPLKEGDEIELGEVALVFHQGLVRTGLPHRSSWYTDRGRRAVNQDAVVVRTLPDGRELAAVCDGMGSHSEGGVASHIALEALVAALSSGSDLQGAVRNANVAVFEAAAETPEREGMGTTIVALLRDGERYEIANVGDSRAYRVSGSEIEQITKDHSFIAEAVEAGRMTLEEAKQSPWKSAVTRSLGTEPEVDVDIFGGFEAATPAIVLLCTDGVHGVLETEDLLKLMQDTPDIRDVARTVAEEALMRGGEDNVGAAALEFGLPADPGSKSV